MSLKKQIARFSFFWAIALVTGILFPFTADAAPSQPNTFAGSASCRQCHERFYQLWSTSFHGLAMQPYTSDFARTKLTPHTNEIAIEGFTYQADISGTTGYVVEKGRSPSESKQYKVEHVLGGKNVYYFLTNVINLRTPKYVLTF